MEVWWSGCRLADTDLAAWWLSCIINCHRVEGAPAPAPGPASAPAMALAPAPAPGQAPAPALE